MHEHMSINLSDGDIGTEHFDKHVADLKRIYELGVRNIVDLTNQSMGRSPEYVSRLMEATGINIIMSSGYYLDEYIHDMVADLSVEELAKSIIKDLTEGLDGGVIKDLKDRTESGSLRTLAEGEDSQRIKAGVIGEIAWSYDGASDAEYKCWEAEAIAAKKTGAVLSTHPTRGIHQVPQAKFLINRGISPDRIIIGHVECAMLYEGVLKEVLDTGVYIGLDMIGKYEPFNDDERADIACLVKEYGYLDKLLLSLDLCTVENLKSAGGYGYSHLFESFIPRLKSKGFTDEDIELVLKENPKRVLMGSCRE